MNKVLIIAIAVISISISAQFCSAYPTIGVEPSYQSVSYGDTFTVNITVDPDGTEILGAQYGLYFDSNILDATSQTSGTFLSQDGTNTIVFVNMIDNTLETVEYSEARTADNGVTGTGVLASVTFEVITTSGTSYLKLGDVILSDPNGTKISNTAIYNGRVGVAQPSTPFLIRGNVSYKDGSDCNDPAVNITNLNISKEWTTETNETSNYYQLTLASCADVIAGEILRFDAISPDKSQSSVTEHTVTQAEVDAGGFEYNITLEYRPGDVNGDGKITPADAVIALQMVVCGEYNPVADVNDDKSVTSLDALMILQAAAEST